MTSIGSIESMSEYIKGFSKHKKRGVAALFLILLVALGAGAFVVLNKNEAPTPNETVVFCHTDAIGQDYKDDYKDKLGIEAVDAQALISQIELTDPNSESVNCVYMLAKIAHYGGQNESALQLYDRLLELNQNNPSVWVDESVGSDTPTEITRLREEVKVVIESLQEPYSPEQYETGLRLIGNE